jgi:histidine triad (HIT) family protein
MNDCVFCRIVANEIPCYKVYEDASVLAFFDIAPVSPGHTVIIPKRHFANLEEVPESELSALIIAVKKVGRLLKDKLRILGYNISENNDSVAGQIVPHLHFHLVPRRNGDNLKLWPGGKYGPGEAEDLLARLRA